MKVLRICDKPEPALSRALEQFEAPFTYPLGPAKFFRISHGEDYARFFRAQGEAACFIAEHQGRVLGVLGSAIRSLGMPDGSERRVAYLGDLKITAEARGGLVLARLARAAEKWLRPQVTGAFGIVMGGTTRTPEAYTGRAGIPIFQDLGRLMILRISGGNDTDPGPKHYRVNRTAGMERYRRLSLGSYAHPCGATEERSEIAATWLVHPENSACGMLEDTRRAKRLTASDGSELLSAHLSCFAYEEAHAGADLIGVALHEAGRLGLPALFVSVPAAKFSDLRTCLDGYEVLSAPAVVYGTGLSVGTWNINSSEI